MVKFEREAFVPWGEDEDNAVMTFYPKHGPMWDGWDEVLPNRTKRAIQVRAQRIGAAPVRTRVGKGTNRKNRQKQLEPRPFRMPDPNERYILRRMKEGLTPSQIDTEKHWIPGTSIRVLTERWDRENG